MSVSLILFISSNVYAEKKTANFGSGVSAKYDDGFQKLIEKKWSPSNFGYTSKSESPAEVFHNLRRASQTVPVAQTASVARQTVLKNLLTKAVAGGRIAAGLGSGPVGWALTAATAYQLVAPTLEENGYRWDSAKSNFVTDKEYKYCLIYDFDLDGNWEEVECVGLGKISRELDLKSEVHLRPIRDAICQRNWQSILPGYKPKDGYRFGYSLHASGCVAVSDTDNGRTSGNWRWYKNTDQVITQSEFDRIIGPLADASPTPYVNATADEKGVVPGVTVTPNVTVPNGTVVTIGPYTDSDGQPKQVTVTFKTANGETTVSVNITPRPDLSPNSSAAPSASPNTGSQSGPSGSPNSSGQTNSQTSPQTGGQTGSQTGSESSPQTGGETRNQTVPKQDGESDKKDEDKPKDGSLLCELFPDILACAKVGEPTQDMFDGISIPQTIDERTWEPDDFLPPNGVCPQPKTFHIWGKPVEMSYTPLCHFMEQVRFAVLLGFIIMSAFIVFGSLRKG